MLYQDIPRIYTAIAEWGSCLVYLYILKKENMKSVHFLAGSLFMLAMQSIFLTLTGNVTEILLDSLYDDCCRYDVCISYGRRKYEASGSGLLLCPRICSC